MSFNSNLNSALITLAEVISDLEDGFTPCGTCGGEEPTRNLDCLSDLRLVMADLIELSKCEITRKEP